MRALTEACGIAVEPRELAFLCQKVENLVAGAPCGVMDQLAVTRGAENRLLHLRCQPGEVLGTIKLPDELAVWGLDSGLRHAIGGADYGTVRTASFMGYRIIAGLAGLPCRETETVGRVEVADDKWQGYLANITPAEFAENYAARLPREMAGADFLARYQGITDTITTVEPKRVYPVAEATRHPVYENALVAAFADILQNWRGLEQGPELGALMYASHESYSACGLGSAGTDELVNLVRARGPSAGLYGARITGGGSGGTVAVAGRRDAAGAVCEIADEYARRGGFPPLVIAGSSPSASDFAPLLFVKT